MMSILEKILVGKKFPSPLILEGSDRVSSIQLIAGYSLCETQTKCGHCRNCKQIAKGFHPDWISLSGATKIEELRDYLFQLRHRPFQSKVRLFTYDHAQDASVFVQNALLKTLEESFAHWVLILGVNSKLSLLPTIRSRCLVYKIPEESDGIELSVEEEKVFRLIEDANEIDIQKELEPIFKDRQKTKSLFQRLLLKASKKKYPGHWQNLSPVLEDTFPELSRNLNPRLVWDRAWAKSQIEY